MERSRLKECVRILLILSILAVPTAAASEPSPISLHLNPEVGFYPTTVYARIIVEPDYVNRGICVVWISEEKVYDGAGCWSIEGQYAAKVHFYPIKHIPVGVYNVRA